MSEPRINFINKKIIGDIYKNLELERFIKYYNKKVTPTTDIDGITIKKVEESFEKYKSNITLKSKDYRDTIEETLVNKIKKATAPRETEDYIRTCIKKLKRLNKTHNYNIPLQTLKDFKNTEMIELIGYRRYIISLIQNLKIIDAFTKRGEPYYTKILKNNIAKKIGIEKGDPLYDEDLYKRGNEKLQDIYLEGKKLNINNIINPNNVSIISIINIDNQFYIIPTSVCLLYYITEDLKTHSKKKYLFYGKTNVEKLQPISIKPTKDGVVFNDDIYTKSQSLECECEFELKYNGCFLSIPYKNKTVNLEQHLRHSLKASLFIGKEEDEKIMSHEKEKSFKELSSSTVILDEDNKNIIRLLAYNVFFGSFIDFKIKGDVKKKVNFAQKEDGEEIIKLINARNPDIMVLCEASPIIPNKTIGESEFFNKIKLKNYKNNIAYHAMKGTNGTLIYWSDKFELADASEKDYGMSYSKKKGKKNFEVDTTYYGRPIVGVRLKHTKTTQIYCVIGVDLAHNMKKDKYITAMNDVLKNIKYNKSTDKILIMGDHNKLYTLLTKDEREEIKLKEETITVKLANKVPHKATCCSDVLNTLSNPRNSNKYNKIYDLVYSDIDNISIDVEKVTYSDHLPLVGSFIIGEKVSEDNILEKEIKTAVAVAATALKKEDDDE